MSNIKLISKEEINIHREDIIYDEKSWAVLDPYNKENLIQKFTFKNKAWGINNINYGLIKVKNDEEWEDFLNGKYEKVILAKEFENQLTGEIFNTYEFFLHPKINVKEMTVLKWKKHLGGK